MLLNSSFSYCHGFTRTLLAELLERGGKGAGTLIWECLSSRTRGCQEQCSKEWVSTVALEWGWGIALLALALPPGCVRYPVVVLRVLFVHARRHCSAFHCGFIVDGGGFLFIEGRMSSPSQRLLL